LRLIVDAKVIILVTKVYESHWRFYTSQTEEYPEILNFHDEFQVIMFSGTFLGISLSSRQVLSRVYRGQSTVRYPKGQTNSINIQCVEFIIVYVRTGTAIR